MALTVTLREAISIVNGQAELKPTFVDTRDEFADNSGVFETV